MEKEVAELRMERIASGLIPDIMQVATEGQYALAQTGVLEPINDYVAANKAYFDSYYNAVDKNFPAWLKLTTPPGPEQYYLPGEDQSMCMWLNRELFAAAGVALPSNDWTWDEFYAIAKRIKSKTGAYGYICDYGSYQGIEPWLLTNGTDQMSADWKTITMDTPAVAEAASLAATVFVAQAYWNDFFWPSVFLSTPSHMTLPVGLVELQSDMGGGAGATVIFAAIVLVVLPVMVLMLLCQRWLIQGISLTANR